MRPPAESDSVPGGSVDAVRVNGPQGEARPVTLLHIATVPVTIRTFLVPYATHFRSLGWRVDAAASDATRARDLASRFDTVHDLPLSRSIRDVPSLVRSVGAIGRLIVGIRPDIVHVHTPIASLVTRLAVRRLPRPQRPSVVYTAHGFHFHVGGNPVPNLVFRTAEQVAGRWTDRLVVINDEDERAALRHRVVPPSRLIRMRGIGVDTSWYAPASISPDDADAIHAELGLPAGVPYFAVVAELRPNKRNADVLRALAAARHREAHLVVAGAGPLRARLEALARQLGLGDRVRFVGFIDDVRPMLRLAAATILASRREGLPRSIMESLAVGTPVIGTTARGVEELLRPDSGIVVPVGDVAAFATAMDWVLDHPAEARAMGLEGRRRMCESYDLQVLIREHERMYAELLAERRAGSAGLG